ncbi:NTP transferase domain-containing protein [soil metagenome]
MGRPKQLIQHEGRSLLSRAAEAAVEAGADPVVVVLGAYADEVRPLVARIDGVTVAVNVDWEAGLASSLTTGLRAVREADRDGVLVTLADQPLVDAQILRRLVAAFQAGARIVASGYGGTAGVPALFGREHVPALLGLTGDAGAGSWLRSRLPEVSVIPLDSALLDIDTPADLARLAGRQHSR